MIQSIVRSGRINSGGKDGNLLKAQSGGEPGCDRRLQPEISVDFTGTDASDPRTGIEEIETLGFVYRLIS